MVFDTGAGINIISSRDAKKFGIQATDITMDMTGVGKQTGHLAWADNIRIGNMSWQNVPFFIVDMKTGDSKTDSAGTMLPPVIGLPIMQSMGEIQFDFVKHEYRNTSGKTYVQQLLESDEDLTDEERTFLTFKQQARASLYEVIAINSAENTLTLRNLFERNEAPVTIIDIGLSNSAKPNHSLIFTRVILLPKFNVISGASSVFLKRKYEKVRKAYEKYYKNLPAHLTGKEKRYIAMFHVNRVHGERMITKPPQDIKDAQTQLESKKG